MRVDVVKRLFERIPCGLPVAFALGWMSGYAALPAEPVDNISLYGLSGGAVVAFIYFAFPTAAALFIRRDMLVVLGSLTTLLMLTSSAVSSCVADSSQGAFVILACAAYIAAEAFGVSMSVACLVRLAKVSLADCIVALVFWQLLVAILGVGSTLVGAAQVGAVFPVLASVLVFVSSRSSVDEGNGGEPGLAGTSGSTVWGNRRGSTRPLVLNGMPYRLFGLNALVIIAIYGMRMVGGVEQMRFDGLLFAGSFAGVVLMATLIIVSKRFVPVRWLYYFALGLLETAIIVFAAGFSEAPLASALLVNTSYVVFAAFYFAVLCNICQRSSVNPIRLFSLAYLIECLAALAGNAIGDCMDGTRTALMLTVFAAAIAFAFARLSTNEDFRTAWGTEKSTWASANPVKYFEMLAGVCASVAMQYSLSSREADVLLLIAQQKTTAQIAEELFISQATVKTHTNNIYKKLDIHSRKELADFIRKQ